jgi:hypothetical protein
VRSGLVVATRKRTLPLTPCLSLPSPPAIIRSEKRSTRHSTRFTPCCANSASHDHLWDRTRLGFYDVGNDTHAYYMPAHCYIRKPSSSGWWGWLGGVIWCSEEYFFRLCFLPPSSRPCLRNLVPFTPPFFSSPLLSSFSFFFLPSHQRTIHSISAHTISTTSNTVSDTVAINVSLTIIQQTKRSEAPHTFRVHIHIIHIHTTRTHYPYSPTFIFVLNSFLLTRI